jgi:hypothetical protein
MEDRSILKSIFDKTPCEIVELIQLRNLNIVRNVEVPQERGTSSPDK